MSEEALRKYFEILFAWKETAVGDGETINLVQDAREWRDTQLDAKALEAIAAAHSTDPNNYFGDYTFYPDASNDLQAAFYDMVAAGFKGTINSKAFTFMNRTLDLLLHYHVLVAVLERFSDVGEPVAVLLEAKVIKLQDEIFKRFEVYEDMWRHKTDSPSLARLSREA